jgi:hypothetical protein
VCYWFEKARKAIETNGLGARRGWLPPTPFVVAQAEIAEAFDWYEDKTYGLGGDFLRVLPPRQSNFPAPRKHLRRPIRGFDASCCGVFRTHCILSC